MKENKRRRRAELWKKSKGLCKWCGVVTVMEYGMKGTVPANQATLQHLDIKGNPLRGKMGGQERTVLACYRCANAHAAAYEASLPKEVLWARSRSEPDVKYVAVLGVRQP